MKNNDYDLEIRQTLNNTLSSNKDYFENIVEGLNDFDMLRLINEFLKVATDKLDKNFDSEEEFEDYNKLENISREINNIVKKYK